MGRFDALTELDEKETQKLEKTLLAQTPPPTLGDNAPVSPTPQAQIGKKLSADGKKPANLQTRKPAKQSPADFDKVEKYTTHLEPSLIKKIKLEAIEKDMKDYDVVRAALIQYFENNK
jgi:hypothetical protein